MAHASNDLPIPDVLRLRVVATRPHVFLTEVQLVDGAVMVEHIDARDHVMTEVGAFRPSLSEWAGRL